MPLGSALARLRQTQLCPTATWVFPQSRRLAAGAGGLCSSPSSWLPPEVRSASLGAGEEHRENTAGRVGITGQTGVPWESPSAPGAERLLGLLGSGQQLSAKCPGWVIGTSVC